MKHETIVTNKQNAMETIFTHNIHKAIVIKAIQQLAFKGSDSAWKIKNSGYTDDILNDLYDNVLLLILELINNDECIVEYDDNDKAKLTFIDSDDNGNSETFLNIYRSVREYLDSRKQTNNKWLYVQDFDDNGNVTSTYSINDKVALSQRANLDTINDMDIIKEVRSKLKDGDNIVLDLLLNGLSYREIANTNNTTLKAVRCAVDRIRKAYPTKELEKVKNLNINTKDKTVHIYIKMDLPQVKRITPVDHKKTLEYNKILAKHNYTTIANTIKKDTIKHNYVEVPKHDLLPQVQVEYNKYLMLQDKLVKQANTSEKIIIEDKPLIMPYTPSNKGLSDSEKERKISIRYEKKHIARCTPFDSNKDRRMLLHDYLEIINTPSISKEPLKAYVIEKKRKG